MEEIVDLMFTRRYAECKVIDMRVAPAAALIKTGKYQLSKWTLKLGGYKGKSTTRRATRAARYGCIRRSKGHGHAFSCHDVRRPYGRRSDCPDSGVHAEQNSGVRVPHGSALGS
jgi:hypothetical protein